MDCSNLNSWEIPKNLTKEMGEAILGHFTNVNISDIATQINGYEYMTIKCPYKYQSVRHNYGKDATEISTVLTISPAYPIRAVVLVGATGNSRASSTEIPTDDGGTLGYRETINSTNYMTLAQSKSVFEQGANMKEISPGYNLVIAGIFQQNSWTTLEVTNGNSILVKYGSYVGRYVSEWIYSEFYEFSFLCKVEYAL